MRIYNFPVYIESWNIPVKRKVVEQPVDLDRIVSVGPVKIMIYTGSYIGESHVFFELFSENSSFRIISYAGTIHNPHPNFVEDFESERLKLIETWHSKSIMI